MRRSYFSDKDFRKNRLIAIIVSLLLHGSLIVGLFLFEQLRQAQLAETKPEDLNFGSSGGGGGEHANEGPVEFGEHQPTREEPMTERIKKPQLELIQIHVIEPEVHADNATPVPEKPKEKPKLVQRKRKPRPSIIAEDLPIGHVRHGGEGPGSGGGKGGGRGGGIGARVGFSIDWGGNGSRRLLSGRYPRYPDGADKQVLVEFKFTVLPDGSVGAIVPIRKTDALFERTAIAALRTWRFDPLPAQLPQIFQLGTVPFNFIHE